MGGVHAPGQVVGDACISRREEFRVKRGDQEKKLMTMEMALGSRGYNGLCSSKPETRSPLLSENISSSNILHCIKRDQSLRHAVMLAGIIRRCHIT